MRGRQACATRRAGAVIAFILAGDPFIERERCVPSPHVPRRWSTPTTTRADFPSPPLPPLLSISSPILAHRLTLVAPSAPTHSNVPPSCSRHGRPQIPRRPRPRRSRRCPRRRSAPAVEDRQACRQRRYGQAAVQRRRASCNPSVRPPARARPPPPRQRRVPHRRDDGVADKRAWTSGRPAQQHDQDARRRQELPRQQVQLGHDQLALLLCVPPACPSEWIWTMADALSSPSQMAARTRPSTCARRPTSLSPRPSTSTAPTRP